MINLAGFDVWLYPGEDPPLSEKGKKRMMIVGHSRLTKRTGQDFGFETRRWHDYLLTNCQKEYCHPYGWNSVLRALDLAEHDTARPGIVKQLELPPEKISTERLAESLVDLLIACELLDKNKFNEAFPLLRNEIAFLKIAGEY